MKSMNQTVSGPAFRFTSILQRSDNRLWGAHLRVPGTTAKQLVDGRSRRVLCTLNDSTPYQCAILQRGRGLYLITVNKHLRERLGLSFGARVHVVLRKDRSEYGLPMPAEFRELLRQDREGNKFFHALTRGRQRTLLYIIGAPKNSDKRIVRAITVVNHLRANNGRINYRQLSKSLKDALR